MVLLSDGDGARGRRRGRGGIRRRWSGPGSPTAPPGSRDLSSEVPELQGLDALMPRSSSGGGPGDCWWRSDRRGSEGFDAERRARVRLLRGQRRHDDRHGAGGRGREAPALDRGLRARAPALGAGAPRRDAPGARGAALRARVDCARRATSFPRRCGQAAIEHIDRGIRNLQGLITELRPSVLDELGVEPAIEALARQAVERTGSRDRRRLGLAHGRERRAALPRARGDDLPARAGEHQQRDQARRARARSRSP